MFENNKEALKQLGGEAHYVKEKEGKIDLVKWVRNLLKEKRKLDESPQNNKLTKH